MSVDALLSRLERVRQTGPGRWIARCPAHEDRSPSLSVRELPDGRVLVHCFGGCGADQIVGAAGIGLEELFPPKAAGSDHVRGERRPFMPADVFEIARQEIGVAAIVACDMRAGRTISEADYGRLLTCVERLDGIARAAYARRTA